MNPYELLETSIEFATSELDAYKLSKDINNNYSIVLSSLYRQVIELSEGVKVCALNGLRDPSELNLRGLIEAYLALKYIVKDPQHANNRAIAYEISYHKLQIEAGEYSLRRNSNNSDDFLLKRTIQYHKEKLQKEEFKEVLDEYDKLQSQNKRGFIPKWYSLYEGPQSINQLAKIIEENSGRNRGLMTKMYGFLSTSSHNYLTLREVYQDDTGNTSLRPVSNTFNPNCDEYNLVFTRSLLTSSILTFTTVLYPEYKNQLLDFVSQIKGYLSC